LRKLTEHEDALGLVIKFSCAVSLFKGKKVNEEVSVLLEASFLELCVLWSLVSLF
jgi:hypothetical protein